MMIATHSRRRRGTVSTPMLIIWSFLLILLIWGAQQLSWRTHARAELQNADDASAHAAVRALVTESVFSLDYVAPSASSVVDNPTSTLRPTLITTARAAAERFASLNRVMGHSLVLKDNPDNLTAGEIYVGTLDEPMARTFVGLARTGVDPFNPDLNAVRAKTRNRSRVGASSNYFIDRDVVGFRLKQPPASSPLWPAIPMVPIAILSDPSCFAKGTNTPTCWADSTKTNESSWENQVMGRQGRDNYYINAAGQPTPGKNVDHIPEITVTLSEKKIAPGDNGVLTFFDSNNATLSDPTVPLLAQIQRGVVYGDLPGPPNGQLPGQFLLNPKDGVPAGTPSALNQATVATAALPDGKAGKMAAALAGTLGQPRIWMLYSGVQGQPSDQTVSVVGFVVARVMHVEGPAGGPLTITLQPSVLVTDKAVTDWTLRNNGPRSLYNPYVARLRFVE